MDIFLNVYEPSWNHFLKSIPFVKSSSLLVRWFAAYIPIAILLGVLALASFGRAKRYAALVAGVLVAVVIGYQAFQDTSYYKTESYSGVWIDQAYWRVRDGGETPLIAGVGLYDSMMQINPRPGQNDMLGIGALRPGSAFAEADGRFNFKNPACYVYPDENNCRPGDQFATSQRAELEAFLKYQPFAFKKSNMQIAADVVNSIALFVLCLGLVFSGRISRWRAKKDSLQGRL